jgi:hypothetical protein
MVASREDQGKVRKMSGYHQKKVRIMVYKKLSIKWLY